MPFFRKRPVVVEAMQYDGTTASAQAIREWSGADERTMYWSSASSYIFIRTSEGTMAASPQDWIIRGVEGELYACKPSIFQQTYEPVTEESHV